MIRVFKLELDLPTTLKTSNIGSVLHGVLMEFLPNELVETLHSYSSYHPLKQRILFDKGKSFWEIVSFSESISDFLLEELKRKESFKLRHHKIEVKVLDFTEKQIKVKELMDEIFERTEAKRYVDLVIKTPIAFKSQGRFEIFPEPQKIFRSIMIQFDIFFKDYKTHDYETLDYISKKVNIVNYRLNSTKFHLEKTRIPSFTGRFTLQLNGPEYFQKLLLFLLHIGNYTGVGVKTSLGMGKFIID